MKEFVADLSTKKFVEKLKKKLREKELWEVMLAQQGVEKEYGLIVNFTGDAELDLVLTRIAMMKPYDKTKDYHEQEVPVEKNMLCMAVFEVAPNRNFGEMFLLQHNGMRLALIQARSAQLQIGFEEARKNLEELHQAKEACNIRWDIHQEENRSRQ